MDARTQGILLLTGNPAPVFYTQDNANYDTAKKQVNRLAEVYHGETQNHRELYFGKVMDSKLSDFNSAAELGRHMKCNAEKLKACGYPAPGWQMTVAFLLHIRKTLEQARQILNSSRRTDADGKKIDHDFDVVLRKVTSESSSQ